MAFHLGRNGRALFLERHDPLILYDFSEGSGQVIKDRSGRSEPLNLIIRNTSAVEWLKDGGLAIRSPGRDLAVLYFAAGGRAHIKPAVLDKEMKARWYNPHDGKWMDAGDAPAGTFTAPDENEWVLLLQKDNQPPSQRR